jgi:uncharacterized protein (TIGR02265 family)
MTDFVEPPWDEPFDAEAYLRAIPEGALIKGYFGATIAAAAKQRRVVLPHAAEKYLPFLEYSLVEHDRLLLDAARGFWPDIPVRQALRKLGRAAVQSLLETTFGKALLGGLTQPDTVMRALASLARAYATTLSKPTGTAEVVETGDWSAIFRVRDAWIFVDSQQVGILEGLFRACGVRAKILMALESPASGEFSCTWEIAPVPSSRPSRRPRGESGRPGVE